MDGGHEAVRPPPRELLHHDRVVEEVTAAAAVRFRHGRAEESRVAHPPPRVAVGYPVAVPVRDPRLDLALREAPELRAEGLVLLTEDVASHAG